MEDKVTKVSPPYPAGSEPDYIVPADYRAYRYAIGKKGTNPFVAICMNPSAARESSSDNTINRIIGYGKKLGYDGWTVFNTYPERATVAANMDEFNEELSEENICIIKEYLLSNHVTEVFGAWGNDQNLKALRQGREALLKMLKEINVKVFYFGTLTKDNNPRHPLQRNEKWYVDAEHKKYL